MIMGQEKRLVKWLYAINGNDGSFRLIPAFRRGRVCVVCRYLDWRPVESSLKVALVQLGCPKNLVDGEWMLGQLRAAGHELSKDLNAEAVIVNTCGFIDSAKEESVNAILQVAELKRSGRALRLIVAGCMAQRYKDELRREIPEIDGFIPPGALSRAVELLESPSRTVKIANRVELYDGLAPRVISTPPHLAYVKIAEGCDNPCTFCPIPSFRGALHSRPPSSILAELASLAEKGVKEAVLIAQDTTAYGRDLGLKDGLAKLLAAIEENPAPPWIRILYAYPNHLTPELLRVIGQSAKVLPYLDLPLQHAHPDILAAMGRGGGAKVFLKQIEKARKAIPGLAVRTTFITGFPGEKREHFKTLEAFVKEARFDHLGVFAYSREEGTKAHRLGDPVDKRTKQRRKEALLALQQDISWDNNRRRVGRVLDVLVEGACDETEHLLQGRAAHQAPEIDGRVLINDGFATPGAFAKVRVTEAHPYDLVGEIIG